MNKYIFISLLALSLFCSDLFAAEQTLLQEFDKNFKTAISEKNPTALAMLVHFPLRVNYPDGSSISLNNAQAITSRFAEIFQPTVCSTVLEQKEPEVMGERGIIYGHGVIWIKQIQRSSYNNQDDSGQKYYGIETVNLPDAINRSAKLEFTCDTNKHHVVIDSTADGNIHYRSWNKPHFINDKPDMEIFSGVRDISGTGVCSSNQWIFKKGDTEFKINESGLCGSEESDATGTLSVSVAGKPKQTWWCY